MLAPYVPMVGTLAHIDNGIAGTLQTLQAMRELVRRYRIHPEIRRGAANVLFLTPERNTLHRAQALFEWVRDHVRYIPDILDVETLAAPDKVMLSLIGDCDDQATLLATLFESVGYPTRFIVAGYQSADTFEHVYLEVCVDGVWFACDPTEPHSFGWAPPDPAVVYVERV